MKILLISWLNWLGSSFDDERLQLSVALHSDAWVGEVLLELVESLESGVGDLADLLRVEDAPLPVVELLVQYPDCFGRFHIDEAVSHIALVLEIYGQIEEVELTLQILLESVPHHVLGVLVRDVLDHQRSPPVATLAYLVQINLESVDLILGVVPSLDSQGGSFWDHHIIVLFGLRLLWTVNELRGGLILFIVLILIASIFGNVIPFLEIITLLRRLVLLRLESLSAEELGVITFPRRFLAWEWLRLLWLVDLKDNRDLLLFWGKDILGLICLEFMTGNLLS
jgi:hypothetical protein